jgi:hypothetical protein
VITHTQDLINAACIVSEASPCSTSLCHMLLLIPVYPTSTATYHTYKWGWLKVICGHGWAQPRGERVCTSSKCEYLYDKANNNLINGNIYIHENVAQCKLLPSMVSYWKRRGKEGKSLMQSVSVKIISNIL